MKKNMFAVAFILALLISAVAGTFLIKRGVADPMVVFVPSPIDVLSPEANRTYHSSNVNFTIFRKESTWYTSIYSDVQCFLDGKQLVRVYTLSSRPFSFFMNDLSFGDHVVKVIANVTIHTKSDSLSQWISTHFYGLEGVHHLDTGNIHFFVEIPPHVSIQTPENNTQYATDTPLSFTASEPVSWMSYAMDGQENVTATGNMTLTRLSSGTHNITVYACDTRGNVGKSETSTFTVAEPFPTAIVVAAVVIVTAVGTGPIVYFKKRKRQAVLQ